MTSNILWRLMEYIVHVVQPTVLEISRDNAPIRATYLESIFIEIVIDAA